VDFRLAAENALNATKPERLPIPIERTPLYATLAGTNTSDVS
jgi:hypothetical protein